MKLDHYVFKYLNSSDEYFTNNLMNNELITRHYQDYNDSHESYFGIHSPWPSPISEKKKLLDLIGIIYPNNHLPASCSIQDLNNFIKSKSHLNNTFLQSIMQSLAQIRYCSFSRRWKNTLMWGHYGDGVKGIALAFDQKMLVENASARRIDSPQELTGTANFLGWIKYSHNPPVINVLDYLRAVRSNDKKLIQSINEQAVQSCTLTKSKDWKYEQESRLITSYKENISTSPVMYKYDRNALKAVIFGWRCNTDKITEVSKIVSKTTDIYLTKPIKSKYKLDILEQYKAGEIASGKVKIGTITN